jgi:hypothetical protein
MFGIIDGTINGLKNQIRRSEEAKFAIGYFFLTGFSLVESDFPIIMIICHL